MTHRKGRAVIAPLHEGDKRTVGRGPWARRAPTGHVLTRLVANKQVQRKSSIIANTHVSSTLTLN